MDLKAKCKHCGFTRGSHSASDYYSDLYKLYIHRDYCPGHEGRMDWDKGPGTTFEKMEERDARDKC
jgi:hypothetical protein